MKQCLTAIFDSVRNRFEYVEVYCTRAEAKRSFQERCNDRSHLFFRYPDDFELFMLGTLDDSSGELRTFDKPMRLDTARGSRDPGRFSRVS